MTLFSTPPTHSFPDLRRLFGSFLLAAIASVVGSSGATADQPTKKEIVRQARASTVFIVAGSLTGSGFVIDREERLVVTCAHVVGSQSKVRVLFPLIRDGRLVAERKAYDDLPGIPATVVDIDPTRDLCVLRLDRMPAEAAVATLVTESAEAGEEIFSIGNPGSSDALWIFTSGTVRQVYRKQARLKSGQEIDALTVETQAPINPGDSGGPMFNSEGKVVGVNSYFDSKAALVSSCIDATEIAAALKEARRWLRANTPAELRDRAQHSIRRKQYVSAMDDLDRLVRLKPDLGSYLLRAESLIQMGPAQEYPARAYTFAICDCVQALRLDPNNAKAYALRGAAFLAREATDQAIADYTDAIRLDPDAASHYVERGRGHSRRKETESALKDFDRALEIDPKNNQPRILRAKALLEAKDFARAVEGFDDAIKADPNFAGLYDFRGDACMGLRRFDQALKDYGKAIELAPNSAIFLSDRANALNELQQYQAASQDCDKALTIQAGNIRAIYQRGRAAYGLGRHAAALEDLARLTGLSTESEENRQHLIDTMILRGRVHLIGTNQLEEGIADLNRALELDPKNPTALNLRGVGHARRKDHDKAIADFTAAIGLDAKSEVYLTNRAKSSIAQEKYDDAVKDLTGAIEINPKHLPAYDNRAKAYEKLNDKEKADADAAKAAEMRKAVKK